MSSKRIILLGDIDVRTLKVVEEVHYLYPSLGEWRSFVVERMVNDGAFAKASFYTMSNHLDIVGKQCPGVRDFKRPRSMPIVWSRSRGNWSVWITELGLSVQSLCRGKLTLNISRSTTGCALFW